MINLRLLKRLLFTIVAFLLSTTASFAHEFEVDGIYYSILSSKTVKVTYRGNSYDSYTNEYTGSVTIPSTVTYSGKTYSVTSIGYAAFANCSGLTSVTIPNSVTSIGSSAFSGCSGLTSVTIPNSVTEIGNQAFRGCSGLTSVTIPNSVTSIGDQAFRGCSGLTEVTIPNSVTSIGYYAFAYCSGLTSVTIGNSVTRIDDGAFYNCIGLTSITIPNSVTEIGDYAFSHCSGLTEVNISDLSAWCKIDFEDYSSNPLYYAHHLKLNGTEITDLTIPDGITEIKKYAFYGCSGLTSVTIPNTVTSIGESAFRSCRGLTSVTIGNSVTSIGNWAFYDCNGLTSVTIPSSVTSIGEAAFYECSGLTEVTIPNSVTSIDNWTFGNCSGLTEVTIPNSVTEIGEYAFYGCSGLTEVTIPNSVTSIGESAFRGCSGLTEVTIGNSVTSIGSDAFYNCTKLYQVINLSKLSLTKGSTNHGYVAYYAHEVINAPNGIINGDFVWSISEVDDVNKLARYLGAASELILPDDYNGENYVIGNSAFYECSGLTSVTIPNSVTSIGNYAFEYCSGLKSVTIPNSVTEIGKYAFYGCSSLKYVDYNAKNLLNVGESTNLSYAKFIIVGENVETIPAGIIDSSAATTIISKNTIPPVCDSNAFRSVNKSKCTLYVPTTSYVDYWSAEVWKEFTNIKPFTEVSEISLGSGNYTIKVGESLQLETTITPSNASISDLIWTSSNPEVATVSSTGKVVGIKLGEATITARTIDGSNLAASCTITVETTLAESIKLSQTEVELAPYETVVLTYTILPQNTTNKSVTWSSSDESIATFKVNNDGSATVLMLKDDRAVITATTNDGSNLSASCVVGKISGVEDVYVEEVAVTAEDGEIVVKNVTGIVTVYNLTGIAVASETADGNEVRFDNLQPGVYIVVVNNKSVKVVL